MTSVRRHWLNSVLVSMLSLNSKLNPFAKRYRNEGLRYVCDTFPMIEGTFWVRFRTMNTLKIENINHRRDIQGTHKIISFQPNKTSNLWFLPIRVVCKCFIFLVWLLFSWELFIKVVQLDYLFLFTSLENIFLL